MFLRFIAMLALICLSGTATRPAIAEPQTSSSSTSKIALDSDIRIFTVAAALNVASLGAISEYAAGLDPDLVQRLKQYYSIRKGSRSDESQFAQYLGLAVSLTDPPELKPRVREEQLPDDTRAILGFQELLREFYIKGHITQKWLELRRLYDEELSRLQPGISAQFLQSDAYLRTSPGGYGSRVLHLNVELAAPINSVNVRVYQNDYYVVIGPSTADNANADEIRHAYLHFHLDDLVIRSLSRIEGNDKFLTLLDGVTGVDTTYTREFRLMTVESLIRAMELRMDRATTARSREVIATAYRSGLLLAPYFFESLQSFQNSTVGFSEAFARMASGVSFKAEMDRFQANFHLIPVPQRSVPSAEIPAPTVAPVDPVRELIVEAQTAYNSKDNEGARALFEKVIRDYDSNNGAALYGLGLLASRAEDVERSQLYFDRTVKSNSADPSMKAWSYIYLGHISDLLCQRDRAVEYYRQAVQIGDNTRDAQTSANNGLKQAFGDQCR